MFRVIYLVISHHLNYFLFFIFLVGIGRYVGYRQTETSLHVRFAKLFL